MLHVLLDAGICIHVTRLVVTVLNLAGTPATICGHCCSVKRIMGIMVNYSGWGVVCYSCLLSSISSMLVCIAVVL